ncbi:MAG: ABC transporter ATP-binding protein [Nevskiales bacterium]
MFSANALRLPTGQTITLEIQAGEIHCLRGDSGVGKTRLLRALADLDDCPGDIYLDGRERRQMPAPQWRSQVMLVPARPRWWLPTAAEHMAKDISQSVELLRLDKARLNSPAHRLSSGEGSRLALLRALACEPAVLLLDEPTAALDEESEAAMEQLLQQYVAHGKHSILWITHSRAQSQRVAQMQWQLSQQALERLA